MNKNKPDRWHGLSAEAQAALVVRDYGVRSLAERIAGVGVEAGKLTCADRTERGSCAGLDSRGGNFRPHDLSATPSRIVRRIRPSR